MKTLLRLSFIFFLFGWLCGKRSVPK